MCRCCKPAACRPSTCSRSWSCATRLCPSNTMCLIPNSSWWWALRSPPIFVTPLRRRLLLHPLTPTTTPTTPTTTSSPTQPSTPPVAPFRPSPPSPRNRSLSSSSLSRLRGRQPIPRARCTTASSSLRSEETSTRRTSGTAAAARSTSARRTQPASTACRRRWSFSWSASSTRPLPRGLVGMGATEATEAMAVTAGAGRSPPSSRSLCTTWTCASG